ncbi:MAG: ATP-binding protein [Alphaproteobacteria bacterium]|nr:ATP-binding protein [Alphaproteobacteria bacterium]
MTAGADRQAWTEANKQYLLAALAVVRERIAAHDGVETGQPVPTPSDLDAARAAMAAPPALDRLCEIFSLSAFEREILLLCAGFELDLFFGSDGPALKPDTVPTFGLALATLSEPHWSALSPASPLRRWSLIEIARGPSLATGPLSIDERILNYLVGLSHLDGRVQTLVTACDWSTDLANSHRPIADHACQCLRRSQGMESTWPVIRLCGHDRTGQRAIAAAACGALGFKLYRLSATDIPRAAGDRSVLARLWDRDAVLGGGALFVECDDEDDGSDTRRTLSSFIDRLQGIVIVESQRALPALARPSVRIDVDKPSRAEQRAIWVSALGRDGRKLNGQIEDLVDHFDLGAEEIRSASMAALSGFNGTRQENIDGGDLGSTLWAACRVQARPPLDDVAQRIEPRADWGDLVLPEPQLQVLRDIVRHVRGRAKVYSDWGFAEKSARGLGIGALFTGDSGTGKTMAAEVLANDLALDLYRIDLSQVVSKYIGETEKNLKRVFDAAEGGGAILLFDEADAIFGKRSDVKDSHDRFANIEISYLLQRVEVYRGLAILTTNMKNALDSAFMRRLRFVVRFPFPDAAQRAEIWRRTFPSATPIEDLDVARLGRMNLAGGNIRNIALNAAFLAADQDLPVTMDHVLQAARSEYAKLDKPTTEAELGGDR